MKKILVFITILASINSCQLKENPLKDIFKGNSKKENKTSDNESVVIKSYYEKSKALKSEITVKNKKKNGPAKKYYPTGELHTLVNYVDNVKVGETVWYYKNGQPYRVTPYVNGKIDGIRKIYYENGKLQAEIPYKNGELVEGTKEYNSKGKLISDKTKIIFETVDLMKFESKYILKMKLSKKARSVEFMQEETSIAGTKILLPVKTNVSGTGKIEYTMPPGSFKMSILKIYAKYTTKLGNPVLISSSYNLAIENR